MAAMPRMQSTPGTRTGAPLQSSQENSVSLVPYAEPSSNQWVELMAPAAELANMIANTEFVPAEMRNKPAVIAACIMFGAELGLGPMMSLNKVDVVKGRPSPRAELARALALGAGHEIWVEESTNTRVIVSGKRRGSSHTHTVGWTMDDAKRAGLAGSTAYAKYPRAMLLARASAELVRAMCPEVLGGITVFAEELDGTDIDTPAPTATPASPTSARTRQRKPRAPTHDEPPELPDGNTEAPQPPTKAQTSMAMALFAQLDIVDRADRLNLTAALTGRPIETWNDVTADEAGRVIDGLERLHSGALAITIDDDGWHVAAVDQLDDMLPPLPE
jgi:hypothetical protein